MNKTLVAECGPEPQPIDNVMQLITELEAQAEFIHSVSSQIVINVFGQEPPVRPPSGDTFGLIAHLYVVKQYLSDVSEWLAHTQDALTDYSND